MVHIFQTLVERDKNANLIISFSAYLKILSNEIRVVFFKYIEE